MFGKIGQASLLTVVPAVIPPEPETPPVEVDRVFAAPTFSLAQDGNLAVVAAITIPVRPALPEGAAPFAPLSEMIVVGAFGDANPFDGVDAAGLEAAGNASGSAEVLNLADADQGTVQTVNFPIPEGALGKTFWTAAVVVDAAV